MACEFGLPLRTGCSCSVTQLNAYEYRKPGSSHRMNSVPGSTQLSRKDRLRRELRNPSLLTVAILVVLVLAIPAAIILPGIINTASTNLAERNEQRRQRVENLLPEAVVLPAQVTPWLFSRIRIMQEATTPEEWFIADFKDGPCNPANLAQFPSGQFTTGIFRACSDIDRIQTKFAETCQVGNCDLPRTAILELDGAAIRLVETFSDANFALPYESPLE